MAAGRTRDDEPVETRGTEHVETVDLAEHAADIRRAREAGRTPPAGRLLGLPELPDNDVWVDIAGASAISGALPKTITGWLTRGGPKRCPFPGGYRFMYRLYWPLAVIEAWTAESGAADE